LLAQLCAGAAYAADVAFWVLTAELDNDLDRHLLATLREWFKTEWAFDCIVFAIGQQDARQATLFKEEGLELRSTFTLPDGRPCWAFS
jgi:hypothetical protein